MACFVIAEAGVNHNGSVEVALRLVEAAANAGADAVKFQTFHAERLVRPGATKAEYQIRETGDGGDQLTMLAGLELPDSAYPMLIARCRELGIEFLSTPFDEQSAEMLVGFGMGKIKVPSGEITNLPLLANLASFGLPIILSTGMSALDEIDAAVRTVCARWAQSGAKPAAEMLVLLHCTSNYPTVPQDVNLRAMQTIREAFGFPVGYSDHTLGAVVAVGAVALGAVVIEKHFTLDRNLPGPDHKASLEPDELADMVLAIRTIEAAMGDGIKAPRPSEIPVRDIVRRSVTILRPLRAGETIRPEDVSLMRPGNGIPPTFLKEVAGRKAVRDLSAWSTLQWEDLEP